METHKAFIIFLHPLLKKHCSGLSTMFISLACLEDYIMYDRIVFTPET